MYLTWPDGVDHEPTEEKIVDLVLSEEYVILSVDELTYIQTAKTPIGKAPLGHIVEYQSGSLADHYRAEGRPFGFHRVAKAMCKYLRNDDSWRSGFRWKWLDLSQVP